MRPMMKVLVALTLLSALGIYLYPNLSGLVLLVDIFIFGGFSHFAKTSQERVAVLLSLALLSAFSIAYAGIRLGIDFKGGTRIPVSLSQEVDTDVLQEIISKIKARVSSLGMEQVVVKAVGNDRIFIEVPAGDEELVSKVESTITTQGVFYAVVDGKVVLEGRDIIPGSVSPLPSSQLFGADWGVSFSITREAAERFAELVRGKANMPLYLYLDKPTNATIVLPEEWILNTSAQFSSAGIQVSPVELLSSLQEAIQDERSSVKVTVDTAEGPLEGEVITTKEIAEKLNLTNATIVSYSDLIPELSISPNPFPNRWGALGLMSAPVLNPSVTDGSISLTYQITGNAPQGLSFSERQKYARETARFISSVLKGGAFPVKLYVGSKETIPAPLGERFLNYSLLGLVSAILAVSVFIAFRYRRVRLVLPIIIVTLLELLILISTVGSFTIDLSAMAGLIAAVGVSIDAQIIITDEYLKDANKEKALKKAFEVINNNVVLAILVFFPLFFTGIVEVVGFAIATILSYVLGALVSRPAYATLIDTFFGKS